MFQKLKNAVAYVPTLLVGATVTSGGTIALESADVSSVGGSMLNAVGSILDILFQFAPYIAGFAAALAVFAMIKKYANLRRK